MEFANDASNILIQTDSAKDGDKRLINFSSTSKCFVSLLWTDFAEEARLDFNILVLCSTNNEKIKEARPPTIAGFSRPANSMVTVTYTVSDSVNGTISP